MVKFKRHLPMSATIAIVVHVVIILFLVIGFQFKPDHKENPLDNINTINATVINTNELDIEKKPSPKDDLKEKQLAEQKKQQEIKRKQEEEKKRLQAELEAEKEKAEEAQKKVEVEQQKAEQIKQQAEAEKQRIEEETRKQAEVEKKRLEEEVKKQAEAEKLAQEKKKAEEAKKLAAEEKRKEEEAKKLAQQKLEEEKKRKEAEKLAAEKAAEQERLDKILAAEEAEINAAEAEAQRVAKARTMSRDIAIYQDALRSRIQSRWRKPINDQSDAWCKVYVRQAPGGYVEDVVVEQCTGDEAFRRSVEEAVWKSDPLPEPPTPDLFDRDLRFKFIPET
ncbi:MAG: cell envelope integrity protein TolA [Gammaproteobacteria bacterium]